MQSLVSTITLSLTFWKLAHNLKEDFYPTHEDLEVSGPSALLIEGKKLHCSLKAYLIAYAFVCSFSPWSSKYLRKLLPTLQLHFRGIMIQEKLKISHQKSFSETKKNCCVILCLHMKITVAILPKNFLSYSFCSSNINKE